MQNITQAEFVQKAQEANVHILDVRTQEECATGIVTNAKTINFMDEKFFLAEIEKLDRNQSYLVYCRSGNRSSKACAMMDAMDFGSTYNLVGGMLAWQGSLSV